MKTKFYEFYEYRRLVTIFYVIDINCVTSLATSSSPAKNATKASHIFTRRDVHQGVRSPTILVTLRVLRDTRENGMHVVITTQYLVMSSYFSLILING